MIIQTWLLPVALMAAATIIAFPLSKYLAWIMDGKYRPLPVLGWCEKRLDSGPQDWKQYTGSLLIFAIVMFIFGYLVLAIQPWMPLNTDGKGMLFPTAIFNSVISFMTNTNLQHYSGDQHLYVRIGRRRLLRARGHNQGFSRRSQTRQLFCGHVEGLGLCVSACCPDLRFYLLGAGQSDDLTKLS
jgi:hypothetical protein